MSILRHRVDRDREPRATDGVNSTLRDPHSFASDLLRLERHYRDEAERLRREASYALQAAQECREWAGNLRGSASS
jgi:hypothetical protein